MWFRRKKKTTDFKTHLEYTLEYFDINASKEDIVKHINNEINLFEKFFPFDAERYSDYDYMDKCLKFCLENNIGEKYFDFFKYYLSSYYNFWISDRQIKLYLNKKISREDIKEYLDELYDLQKNTSENIFNHIIGRDSRDYPIIDESNLQTGYNKKQCNYFKIIFYIKKCFRVPSYMINILVNSLINNTFEEDFRDNMIKLFVCLNHNRIYFKEDFLDYINNKIEFDKLEIPFIKNISYKVINNSSNIIYNFNEFCKENPSFDEVKEYVNNFEDNIKLYLLNNFTYLKFYN